MTLEAKAAEVRRFILETALQEGKGHVASALSWVEIAVALHSIMKPDDRLVLSKDPRTPCIGRIMERPAIPGMWPGWPHKCSGSPGMGLWHGGGKWLWLTS